MGKFRLGSSERVCVYAVGGTTVSTRPISGNVHVWVVIGCLEVVRAEGWAGP